MMIKPNKPTLAIDIDDVLAANAAGFVKFSNERWGTNLTVDDYDEHWAKVWQVDDEESERRAALWHEGKIVSRYEHFPEAEVVLGKLHEKFRIIVVTSRRRMIEPETRAWINTHFAGLVDDIHFAGFYDSTDRVSEKLKMTKADILTELQVDYFIDDQPKHVFGAASVGISSILFGDYSWNQVEGLPEDVTRCASWGDVANYFEVTRGV